MNKTKGLADQTTQCLVYPATRKAAKLLAREIIETEVGQTPAGFWNKLKAETRKSQWETLVSRQGYEVQARLAYASKTLWILEGATKRKGQELLRPWTIEVLKGLKAKGQPQEVSVWIYGLEAINGGI